MNKIVYLAHKLKVNNFIDSKLTFPNALNTIKPTPSSHANPSQAQ